MNKEALKNQIEFYTLNSLIRCTGNSDKDHLLNNFKNTKCIKNFN